MDLHNQLARLGEMMGDGLHHEPGGAWIRREYRRIATQLGYIKPTHRRNNSSAINERMKERLQQVACPKCAGLLKQTRSGSMRAQCEGCGSKFQMLRRA